MQPASRNRILLSLFTMIWCACEHTPDQFTKIAAAESGLDFSNTLAETQYNNIMTYEYSYNGGGVAAGDLNNDGLADIYFTGNTAPGKLYLNKGGLRFEDITAASGAGGRPDWRTGVTMADVNGDGWLDIYVCYSGNTAEEGYDKPVIRGHPSRANQLFINNGGAPGGVPTFTERAAAYGLDAPGTFSTQAYFFDFDADGDLDMFLLNHANLFYSAFLNTRRLRNLRHPYFGNRLYRNDTAPGEGDPVFTDISDSSGIHGSGLNFGLSASITDLNMDQYPDIYVTNDYEEQDFCYINNGDGTFDEVSKTVFGHLSKFGMGSDVADINNDGYQDIVVLDMLPEDNHRQKLLKGPDEYDRYALAVDSGYHHQFMRNTLQLNRGFAQDSLPRFSEAGQLAGISNTDWSWAPLAADFDNDGLRDLFISNGFLRDFNNLDFIKYNANALGEAHRARRPVDYLALIQKLPSTKLSNYVFRNVNGLQFEDVTKSWGLDYPSVSNGAAYADFDNDGDLDIVTNNLDDKAFLFRNNQEKKAGQYFLKIRLKGSDANTSGIGAKVWVTLPDKTIFQEAFFGRGYQSSVEPVLTIGTGSERNVVEVRVRWPDGSETVEQNIEAGQTIMIAQHSAAKTTGQPPLPNPLLIEEVTAGSGLNFRHRENNFVDFKVQRLLFYQISRLGGKFSKGDVNGDGNDDVFFNGAVGQSGRLYLGQDDGTFRTSPSQPWATDSLFEDVNSLFFDADRDGDEDLYVVSGGSEFVAGAPLYQDRLYINDGTGRFMTADDVLPAETSSGSVAVAADFDKDGDADLFVGGRLAPGNYGFIPRSFLLQNNSKGGGASFADITTQHEGLSNLGMVTCALWTDINQDSWPDLIVTGEWMPIRIFENQQGRLVEKKDIPGLENSNGWWCSIVAADVDNDGDTDYLLGNAGTNLQFKASENEPVRLHAWDFNGDGKLDPVLSYFIQGKSYPLPTRDELLDQISTLKRKFVTYADYADATIQDIATESQLEKAYKFNAFQLQSCWLENAGKGQFRLHPLPALAQLSSINGFIHVDLGGDGQKEVVAAGNFYPYKPQLGRSDAAHGIVLRYKNGAFANPPAIAEVWLNGDIRHMEILQFKSGIKRILVSRNNDAASVFAVRNAGSD